jgi:hypothetical protein
MKQNELVDYSFVRSIANNSVIGADIEVCGCQKLHEIMMGENNVASYVIRANNRIMRFRKTLTGV